MVFRAAAHPFHERFEYDSPVAFVCAGADDLGCGHVRNGRVFYGDRVRPLAVIFVVAIPVLVLSLISYVRKYEAYTREIQRLTSDLSTRIEESVRGIRVVKALGRSPEQITEYTRDAEHLNEVEHRRAMLVARVGFYQRVIVGAVTMLALLVARRRWHRVVFLWVR